MSTSTYGQIVNGVCVNVLAIDTDTTDLNEFAAAIGGELLRLDDFNDGNWGIGATYANGVITTPHADVPDVDPDAPAPEPELSITERLDQQQRQLDDITAMLLGGEA